MYGGTGEAVLTVQSVLLLKLTHQRTVSHQITHYSKIWNLKRANTSAHYSAGLQAAVSCVKLADPKDKLVVCLCRTRRAPGVPDLSAPQPTNVGVRFRGGFAQEQTTLAPVIPGPQPFPCCGQGVNRPHVRGSPFHLSAHRRIRGCVLRMSVLLWVQQILAYSAGSRFAR